MLTLFNTALSNPIIVVLTVIYAISCSIAVFDAQLFRAKRDGVLPSDEPEPPKWVGIFGWISWIITAYFLLWNWKFAVITYIIKFILTIIPVLEIAGNFLLAPLRSRSK